MVEPGKVAASHVLDVLEPLQAEAGIQPSHVGRTYVRTYILLLGDQRMLAPISCRFGSPADLHSSC